MPSSSSSPLLIPFSRSLAFVLALAGAGLAAPLRAADARPNILFLLADDLGWVDLAEGATSLGNGSHSHQTPHIDRLSHESLSFDHAYVQQNCAPTRAALLTGEYATRPGNGVYNVGSLDRPSQDARPTIIVPPKQTGKIPADSTTIARVLSEAGYITALFGKEHGFKALPAGFDVDLSCPINVRGVRNGHSYRSHYFAAPDAQGAWHFGSARYDRYAQPYTADYVRRTLLPFANGNDPMTLVGTPKHYTDAIADAATDFIREHAGAGKPFYMNVSFHAVHVAIVPRPDLEQKYARRGITDPRHPRAAYSALVEGLDQSVGRILRALEDPNGDGDTADSIVRNTLVVFLSDNGGNGDQTANTPLRGAKGMFYEGGIRVPLMVRWPGVTTPDTITAEPVHAVDFFPTLAEIGGAKLPAPATHPLDGSSFVPVLRDCTATLVRDTYFWHFPGYMDVRQVPNSVIVKRVDGTWFKLIYYYEAQVYELYDLTHDLSEATNLLAGQPAPAVVARAGALADDLRGWLERSHAPLGTVRKTKAPVGLPVPLASALTRRTVAIDGTPIEQVRYPQTGGDDSN